MIIRSGLIVLLSLLLAACSEPLPADKLNYAGEWQSKEMKLLILADGTVAYKRLQHGGSTEVNGPLMNFDGDNFVVGIWVFNTKFEVSEPPAEVNGKWQMVVDGVRLTKLPE